MGNDGRQSVIRNRDQPSTTCFKCGKTGHIARYCRSGKSDKGKGKNKERGFFGKMKDKAIGTKEEREEARRREMIVSAQTCCFDQPSYR